MREREKLQQKEVITPAAATPGRSIRGTYGCLVLGVTNGYHSVEFGTCVATTQSNQPTTFIGRSFLNCSLSTAVAAVAVAADAAAASTTDEELY